MFKTIITGRLGGDCVIKEIGENQKKYISFTVACQANRSSETQWLDVMFRTDSEGLVPYLKKGRQVSVIGHLQIKAEIYEGKAKPRVTLWAEDVELLGDKKD